MTIGNSGLTPGVIAEVERSLKAHELIKIRIGGMEHAERESACEAICGQTGATRVQNIGKILVVYRKRPQEESNIATRKPRKKPAAPGKRVGKPPALRRVPTSKPVDARAGATRRARTSRA